MDRYRPEELEVFLREVDRELSEPVDIIVIGGAAVGLGYGGKHATKDNDLWTSPAEGFSGQREPRARPWPRPRIRWLDTL